MKKNIFKISLIISLIAILLGVLNINVNATSTSLEADKNTANTLLANFLSDYISENSNCLYYINSNRTKLYNKANERFNYVDLVDYTLDNISKDGDAVKIEIRIKAKGKNGENWSTEGSKVYFKIINDNGTYKINDTDFFDKTSQEGIIGDAIPVLVIAGIIFVVFFVIVIVLLFVFLNMAKKKSNKN